MELKELINSFQEEIIKNVQDLIKIKSISGDNKGPLEALGFYLKLGENMGFKSSNIENLGGIIQFGEGDETIGIIVHLDVVPEGTGWQYPPFEGQIQDGKIYGRGAIDDKGPAISALYALKAAKDSGIDPKCRIQIIIGIDEETVWNTTPKLLQKIQEPDFSFVPDSKFPIVIAEKGLVWLEISKNLTQTATPIMVITKMLGGSESLNIVPDNCEADLRVAKPEDIAFIEKRLSKFLEEKLDHTWNIELIKNPDSENPNIIKLVSHGKSAHAFSCEEGWNAISQLAAFLGELDLGEGQKEFLALYNSRIGMENYGESLGLALEDELTGKLTVSPGYILMDEHSAALQLDIRFPAAEKLETFKRKLGSAFEVFQGNLKFLDSLESLSFPQDDPHIQRLLKVYQDFTGDTDAQLLGMGGTTFAKAFQRAVAFGPTFPGMAKVEHQPDEYMEIEHLLKCTEIYALAIAELAQGTY